MRQTAKIKCFLFYYLYHNSKTYNRIMYATWELKDVAKRNFEDSSKGMREGALVSVRFSRYLEKESTGKYRLIEGAFDWLGCIPEKVVLKAFETYDTAEKILFSKNDWISYATLSNVHGVTRNMIDIVLDELVRIGSIEEKRENGVRYFKSRDREVFERLIREFFEKEHVNDEVKRREIKDWIRNEGYGIEEYKFVAALEELMKIDFLVKPDRGVYGRG